MPTRPRRILRLRFMPGYRNKTGPFRFELFTVSDVRAPLVRNDLRKVKAIEADVSEAMKAAGCRQLDIGQVYLGNHNPRRLWCAHKSLVAKYSKMSKKQLTAAYAAERDGKPPDPDADVAAAFGYDKDDDAASSSIH